MFASMFLFLTFQNAPLVMPSEEEIPSVSFVGPVQDEEYKRYYFLANTLITVPSGYDYNYLLKGIDKVKLLDFLKTVAKEKELMCEIEGNAFFYKTRWLKIDLETIQARYREFINVPKSDIFRFIPNEEFIRNEMRFSCGFTSYLKKRMEIETDKVLDFQNIIRECDIRYAIWDDLRDANSSYRPLVDRRRAIAKYIKSVGEDAFYSGKTIPIVPLEYFYEDR